MACLTAPLRPARVGLDSEFANNISVGQKTTLRNYSGQYEAFRACNSVIGCILRPFRSRLPFHRGPRLPIATQSLHIFTPCLPGATRLFTRGADNERVWA